MTFIALTAIETTDFYVLLRFDVLGVWEILHRPFFVRNSAEVMEFGSLVIQKDQ